MKIIARHAEYLSLFSYGRISFNSIFLFVEAVPVPGDCAKDSDCTSNKCDKENGKCLGTHLSILHIYMFSFL